MREEVGRAIGLSARKVQVSTFERRDDRMYAHIALDLVPGMSLRYEGCICCVLTNNVTRISARKPDDPEAKTYHH